MNFKTYHKIEKRFVTIHDINFENSTVSHDAQGEFRIDVSKFDDLIFLRLTGLRDKANQEIYEGDILSAEIRGQFHENGPIENKVIQGEVIYDEEVAAFKVGDFTFDLVFNIEIVGNINEK